MSVGKTSEELKCKECEHYDPNSSYNKLYHQVCKYDLPGLRTKEQMIIFYQNCKHFTPEKKDPNVMGKLRCKVCGSSAHFGGIYCSEECENVMRKSRGFMCDVCESINVKQIPSGIVSNIYSGILCRDCGRLIINHEVLFSGDKNEKNKIVF